MRDPSRSTLITVIVLGAVFVLGYLLGAANTRRAVMRAPARPPAAATGGPHLTPVETVFQFGVLPSDGTARHVFKITNTGSANLVIDGIEPECGCTVASLSTSVIAPGASADIDVTFSGKGQRGEIDKEIEIESNDPAAAITELHVTGRVLAPGEAVPAAASTP